MKPIAEITAKEAQGIKYILMDIDDTLTCKGKLPASSYSSLWKLKEAGFIVIPITGRPAGWCDLITRQWPVDGVVGENGAFAFWEEPVPNKLPVLKAEYHKNAVKNDHPILNKVKQRVFNEFPELRLAKDQFARLFDIAIDFAEEDPVLPMSTAQRVKNIAEEEGAIAKISSIHVNIWMGNYTKLSMTEIFLTKQFGWQKGKGDHEVIFIGDSPNDEPMFARFPLACAVANINHYKSLINHFPVYVATMECGDGFTEIIEILLKKRK